MTKNNMRKTRVSSYKVENSASKKKKKKAMKKAKPKVKIKKRKEHELEIEENSNILNKENNLPNIKSLESDVLKYIIGQDEHIKEIVTAIYKAKKFKTLDSTILIIGNSGTGKTATIKQIAKRLNIPYTIEDATKYTQEGYWGANVEDIIYNLLENAQYDFEKAKNGIIIVDEIDKKSGHDEHDVAGVKVLESMLKITEGTIIKIPDPNDPFAEETQDFDTKDIIFIFLGAFSGLDKIRDKRLNNNPLGFVNPQNQKQNAQKNCFLKQDLVEYGMTEEFVGRIDTIIEMNKLTKQDLALILKKSELSIFRKYQEELRSKGITLVYDENLFELIAEKSMALDTGARELSNTVNYIFANILYDVLANPNKYSNCKLFLEIVEENTKYELS